MAGATLGAPIGCLQKEVLGNVPVAQVSFPNVLCRERQELHFPPVALVLPKELFPCATVERKLLSPSP